MSEGEICYMTAAEMADRIRKKDLSAVEVMEAHLARIEEVNPRVNAIVTLLPERAMEGARAADEALAKGVSVGPLHGLPVAHKDLALTKGIRTTFGSSIFRDFVPEADALIVERLKAAGAVTVGKTNTPEFGAGSQTFNEVFGETLNPYDTTKTSGGSSGGAAAALAQGMLPIADGSDMGGSLRNPASFCNVVGLRPSPGRVPTWPDVVPHPLSVEGPMARTVGDVALMLSAIAGPDPRSPLSISEPANIFSRPLDRNFRGTKIAWSRDLGGLPRDNRIADVIEGARPVFEALGCEVVNAEPNLKDADEVFKTLRAWRFELAYGGLLKEHREEMKDTVVWNIEEGIGLRGPKVGWAEKRRAELYHEARGFMDAHEFLVLPVVQVPPFDAALRYPTEINGEPMETYIDWMKSCYLVTVMGLPAISVPCGFTPEGLPIGIQIVGRPRDDLGVLQLFPAFRPQTRYGEHRPPLVK